MATRKRTPQAPSAPQVPTIYPPDKYPRLRADLRKIKVDANGCWNWVGGESKVPAAIYVYELLNDTLESGTSLESTCRNDFCVCPFHMKEVTSKAPKWFANLADPFHRLLHGSRKDPKKMAALPKSLREDLDQETRPEKGKSVNYPTFGKKDAVKEPPTFPTQTALTPTQPREAMPKATKAPKITPAKIPQDIVELCGNGHPKTPDNTYTSLNGTKKECRICKKLRDKKRKGHR